MEEATSFVYDARRGIAFLLFGGVTRVPSRPFGSTGSTHTLLLVWLMSGALIMPPSPEVLAAVKVAINQFGDPAADMPLPLR